MDSSFPAAASSSVEELVRREVADWDDEVVCNARFKAFSGQRSDWEPSFLFWRDLIIKIARHLGVCIIDASEVKNVWFSRGGLTPLCIDHVLREMHTDGDILLKEDLLDPTSGRLYMVLRRVGHLIGISKSWDLQGNLQNHLILKTRLQERCADVIKILAESHWTSTCIVTMGSFQSICKSPDEAFAILSHLCECGKARYFSIKKKDFIEGVKVSLVSASVLNISSLDCDVLHLICTTEKLQQQLDVIDKRWESSRKMALSSHKSGNKQVAYRYIRQVKLFSESRAKCISFLERVEEVLGLIANAESTKKVSEAIQIGAQAIKENNVTVEEVYTHLQDLEENVASQKQVDDALASATLQYVDIEDEDVEEEFKKLEEELAGDTPKSQTPHLQNAEPVEDGVPKEVKSQESPTSLSKAMSNLSLEAT
ncbi:charged multivesicular body protein 7 isoform X1 [Dioscorea cayenensis subsp. rotundata]|uniref:Charged multivesicular body protein 7 isoform X1 n=1 Tax=Dioscorea cayennensis subsp. rotundata TaxID=55577 RepID=A0AB40BN17_DIOCR|nr:charged multivesicular body protein 7 isoform X1 [Dioscorea cayenensis subsp. rotundata]